MAGMLALVGFALWLIAFFMPPALAWLLTVANLLGGVGLAWIGWSIWTAER
jgi:threonine/homoserine/homoserine lactone efflux protein